MRAKTISPVARRANDTLRPTDLRLDERAREVYHVVTKRPDVMLYLTKSPRRNRWYRLRRSETGSRSLTAVGEEILDLAAAGATEAEVRHLHLFVGEVIDACFCGRAHRSLDDLDREECEAEARENHASLELRIAGATPERLESAAAANEFESVVQMERARLLRRTARQMQRGDRSTLPPAA